MQLILGVVADAANKAVGDKLNILGVFHTIGSAQFPVVHPHLALALEFRANPLDKGKTFNFQIDLLGPDAQNVAQMGGQMQIAANSPMLSPIVPMDLNLHNLQFPVEGNYRFEISINGEAKGRIELELVKLDNLQA